MTDYEPLLADREIVLLAGAAPTPDRLADVRAIIELEEQIAMLCEELRHDE